MASANQLIALLKSHAQRDDERFYSVVMQLAAHEAKIGHGKLAEELRALVDQAKARRGLPPKEAEKAVPIGRPRGELAELLGVSYPTWRWPGCANSWAAYPNPAVDAVSCTPCRRC